MNRNVAKAFTNSSCPDDFKYLYILPDILDEEKRKQIIYEHLPSILTLCDNLMNLVGVGDQPDPQGIRFSRKHPVLALLAQNKLLHGIVIVMDIKSTHCLVSCEKFLDLVLLEMRRYQELSSGILFLPPMESPYSLRSRVSLTSTPSSVTSLRWPTPSSSQSKRRKMAESPSADRELMPAPDQMTEDDFEKLHQVSMSSIRKRFRERINDERRRSQVTMSDDLGSSAITLPGMKYYHGDVLQKINQWDGDLFGTQDQTDLVSSAVVNPGMQGCFFELAKLLPEPHAENDDIQIIELPNFNQQWPTGDEFEFVVEEEFEKCGTRRSVNIEEEQGSPTSPQPTSASFAPGVAPPVDGIVPNTDAPFEVCQDSAPNVMQQEPAILNNLEATPQTQRRPVADTAVPADNLSGQTQSHVKKVAQPRHVNSGEARIDLKDLEYRVTDTAWNNTFVLNPRIRNKIPAKTMNLGQEIIDRRWVEETERWDLSRTNPPVIGEAPDGHVPRHLESRGTWEERFPRVTEPPVPVQVTRDLDDWGNISPPPIEPFNQVNLDSEWLFYDRSEKDGWTKYFIKDACVAEESEFPPNFRYLRPPLISYSLIQRFPDWITRRHPGEVPPPPSSAELPPIPLPAPFGFETEEVVPRPGDVPTDGGEASSAPPGPMVSAGATTSTADAPGREVTEDRDGPSSRKSQRIGEAEELFVTGENLPISTITSGLPSHTGDVITIVHGSTKDEESTKADQQEGTSALPSKDAHASKTYEESTKADQQEGTSALPSKDAQVDQQEIQVPLPEEPNVIEAFIPPLIPANPEQPNVEEAVIPPQEIPRPKRTYRPPEYYDYGFEPPRRRKRRRQRRVPRIPVEPIGRPPLTPSPPLPPPLSPQIFPMEIDDNLTPPMQEEPVPEVPVLEVPEVGSLVPLDSDERPLSSRIWNETNTINILKNKMKEVGPVIKFTDCCDPKTCSKKSAASFFHSLLVKCKDNVINLHQENPWDPDGILIEVVDKTLLE